MIELIICDRRVCSKKSSKSKQSIVKEFNEAKKAEAEEDERKSKKVDDEKPKTDDADKKGDDDVEKKADEDPEKKSDSSQEKSVSKSQDKSPLIDEETSQSQSNDDNTESSTAVGDKIEEFLVKYKGLSYLETKWLTEADFSQLGF